MIRRGRRSSGSWIKKLVLTAFVVGGIVYFYQKNSTLYLDEIVDNSELNNANFNVQVEEITSPKKKIKAYLFEDKTNPIVSLSFIFKNAGTSHDDADKNGLAKMTAAMLDFGAGKYDASAFSEELENNAISLDFSAGLDDFMGTLLTTKEKQAKAGELLKLVVTEPRFEAGNLAQVKAQMLVVLKQQQENPEKILGNAFFEEVYSGHPYARNVSGDAEAIRKMTAEQLHGFMHNYLTLDNLIVGAAGDINAEELGMFLDEVFGMLPRNGNVNFVREAEPDFDGRIKNIPLPLAQDIAIFMGKGVERNHPDFYPLYVANYILGGSGLNSRLNLLAREKEGLSYGISTYLGLADKSPTINGNFSATPDNFEKVMNIITGEMDNFKQNGISAKELADAKNYLISSYNLRFADISDIAEMMAYMQRDNLGIDFLQKRNDYVSNVKLEDVNRAAKEYFDKDKMVFMNIGNFDKKDQGVK